MKRNLIALATLCCLSMAAAPVRAADAKKSEADRQKELLATNQVLLAARASECKFKEADALSEAILKMASASETNALAKAYDAVLAAWGKAGVFGCEASRKWWDRAAKDVPRSGDAKWKFLDRHAAFLEQYALASMDEVDAIRAERDKVEGLSPEQRFQNALNAMDGGDVDEVYAKALTNALALAGADARMRRRVYDRALSGGWNQHGGIPYARNPFIRDVVLKDEATLKDRGYFGRILAQYAKNGYRETAETEKFLKTFENVNAAAVRGALRELWSIAGQRYYHGLDPVFAKKILATHQADLAEREAARPVRKDAGFERDVDGLRRRVVGAALAADEPAVAEAMLAALEKGEKPDRAYVACRRGELAFRAKDYAKCVELLKPLADDKSLDKRWDLGFPAEALVRSLVATGDVEEAARIMEKKIGCFPRWRERNYYRPRLEALKRRAAEAKKAREAAASSAR